jgi:hypothetical protein
MTLPSVFTSLRLENRLGQSIDLGVQHIQAFGRDYVFVAALTQQASSVVAKNAQHFGFQLRDFFQLDARRFEMMELRGDIAVPHIYRWRFEWVGASPITPRCELITSRSLLAQLFELLDISGKPNSVLA